MSIIPTANSWISVKDKLPNSCETIIFCTKYKGVYIGSYSEKRQCFEHFRVTYNEDEVLCWQPLPEPPKENE